MSATAKESRVVMEPTAPHRWVARLITKTFHPVRWTGHVLRCMHALYAVRDGEVLNYWQ